MTSTSTATHVTITLCDGSHGYAWITEADGSLPDAVREWFGDAVELAAKLTHADPTLVVTITTTIGS